MVCSNLGSKVTHRPGATVMAWPDFTGTSGTSIGQVTTGPTGAFSLEASGALGPWHFIVSAPRLPAHMGVHTVTGRDSIEIALDPQGGTLVLEGIAEVGGNVVLSHGGTSLPLQGFARVVFRDRAPEMQGDSLVLSGVEPGEYALCDTRAMLSAGGATEASCTSGVLAPYGELRLSPPPAGEAPGR